jgi:hypothetical protein
MTEAIAISQLDEIASTTPLGVLGFVKRRAEAIPFVVVPYDVLVEIGNGVHVQLPHHAFVALVILCYKVPDVCVAVYLFLMTPESFRLHLV